MSTTTYYTFCDRERVDPIWGTRWANILAQRPSKRRRFTELVRFGFNVGGRAGGSEPSDQQVAHILATKTIRWTVRRSTPQFFLISEILAEPPHLRRAWRDISTRYAEDCLAVIAAGIDQWTRAAIDDPTLEAILKLHNCPEPGASCTYQSGWRPE